jgi:hypothetical protein
MNNERAETTFRKIFLRDIEHALSAMKEQLRIYRTLADDASYFFAEAETRRLQDELNNPSLTLDGYRELFDRTFRQMRALAQANLEWQGLEPDPCVTPWEIPSL